MISQSQSLLMLNNLHLKYLDNFIKLNPIEKAVSIKLKENFLHNELNLIGEIPFYTMHNLQETQKRILEIDEDGIIGVVGEAGMGKTNVSIICSFFLDKNFEQKRIIFDFYMFHQTFPF